MFIRVECRDALKAAIENVTSVQVTKGFDGPDSVNEEIYLGPTSGAVSYDVFANNIHPHDDQFTVDVLIRADVPGQDQDVAEARTQELMSLIDAALSDPSMNALTDSDSHSTAFLFDALLVDGDGPHTEPTDEGYRGFASVTIAFHTRTQYT